MLTGALKALKSWSIIPILLLITGLPGCSSTNIRPSSAKFNSTILTNDVRVEKDGSLPVNDTDVFSRDDNHAIMWVRLEDISGSHSLRWDWFDPSGKLYYSSGEYNINIDGRQRRANTSWHKIGIKDEKAAMLPGKWEAKLYLDGKTIASKKFEIMAVSLDDIVAGRPKVQPDGRKWALVIGIEKYKKAAQVQFAEKDASLVSLFLTRSLGVPSQNLITLLNDNATKAELEFIVKDRLKGLLREDDTLYVYYSGHGIPSDETPYLLPYDGDAESPAITAYPLEALYKDLDSLKAKNIFVFLDTCFSGRTGRQSSEEFMLAGARPGILKVKDPMLLSEKMVVMAAAKSNQVSNYYKEQAHGMFTYYLVKGAIGGADKNADRKIQVEELSNYLNDEVSSASRRLFGLSRVQTPQTSPWLLGERQNKVLIELSK